MSDSEKLRNRLVSSARRRGASPEDAEDLAQEVMKTLHTERYRAIHGEERVRVAFGVLRNHLAVWHRRRAAQTQALAESAAQQDASETIDPAMNAEAREHLFTEVLAHLDPTDRLILQSRLLRGMRIDEIAAVLGISESAASQRLYRTIRAIRERMREYR